MGCNCGKRKSLTAGGGQRVVVYQVILPDGSLEAEYDNRIDARKAMSTISGGRLRQIAKFR